MISSLSKFTRQRRFKIDIAASLIRQVCSASPDPHYLTRLRRNLNRAGIQAAVQSHDTAALYTWLLELVSYQGVSDAIAWRYMEEHGRPSWTDVAGALSSSPSCPRLGSYWHFDQCGYAKAAGTCAEPVHIRACPLPSHNLRNGRLNQATYSLFLFIRDVCDGDLVGWIDAQLAAADRPGELDRAARMRQAVLEPLSCVYGVARKVISMALADLLLGGDPERERWVATGASMIVVDTLVHNWLHRTGCLHRLGAEHGHGPGCYAPGACASIIEQVASHIDAREFCPEGPAFFPRLIQKAIWTFCAEGGLGICNGNRIDDSRRCENAGCDLFDSCERRPLRSIGRA